MKLVVGLGNPGPRYAGSRHNIGFMVADELARRWRCPDWRHERDYEGLLTEAMRGDERAVLLKPMTLMNLSGRSVSAFVRFFKLPLAEVLVVFDDLDLPPGQLRIRAGGSAGGHRGMGDIVRALADDQVARVRIGIGKVHRSATVEHVLGRFDPAERAEIEPAIALAADAAECWIAEGVTAAMNRFNRRPSRDEDAPASGAN